MTDRKLIRNTLSLAVAATLALGSLPAGAAAGDATYVTVPVEAVTPVYETVRVVEPEEVCRTERVAVRDDRRRGRSATPYLLGGLIGGGIGNAVGAGEDNKKVGAVIGALLGASIAGDIARHGRQAGQPRHVGYEQHEVCELVEFERTERQLAGYDVTYAYGGREYQAHMNRDPGATIRLRVDVTPLD